MELPVVACLSVWTRVESGPKQYSAARRGPFDCYIDFIGRPSKGELENGSRTGIGNMENEKKIEISETI